MPKHGRVEPKTPEVPEKEPRKAPTSVPQTKTRAGSYQVIYANSAVVSTAYYDMRLHFNDVLSADKSGIFLEEKVSIVMSPEHTKELHRVLGEGLAHYEKKFGSIRSRPDQGEVKTES